MQTTVVPYCGAAPVPTDIATRWNADPILIAAMVAAFVFCRTKGARTGPLMIGWAIALLLFVSPLCALGSALFSVRVFHHLVLTTVVAPLLVLAMPRNGNRITAWTLGYAAILWVWHTPAAYSIALASHAAYWLMQLSLLGSAFGLWRAIRAAPPPTAVAALLATMVQMGVLGALLTFAATPLYAWHAATTGSWGLSPIEDQQLAGLIMWVPGAGIYLAAALQIANRWFRERERLATAG